MSHTVKMTEEHKTFLELAVVQQLPYEQISSQMGVSRDLLSLWWEELKEQRESLSKVRQIWTKKCSAIGFDTFYQWHCSAVRKCHYCNITEDEIGILITRKQTHTKRLITRGRRLEIERREPNKAYDETANLVFCCYWCNNAKSDEFTEEEFKKLGDCISEIWNNRLANDNRQRGQGTRSLTFVKSKPDKQDL